MVNVVDPRFMDVMSWTASVIPLIGPFGYVPQLLNEDSWRDWATYIITIPTIAQLSPPSPQNFEVWEDWATQMNIPLALLAP